MQVIGIYPGRFHPFHKGHAASFNQLAKNFGPGNTYLAISAKQEQPKSPFSAQDRAAMATALGIPAKNILAVRNPYSAQEYIDQLGLDPEKTAIVFGVSKKDMEGEPALGIPPDPRFSFAPKKDGSPSYLQPYTKKIEPMSQHGYIMSTDVAEFPIAGKQMRDASAIRAAYAGADNKTKMKILRDLYGDAAEKMKQVFDNNLQVTESIRRLIATIKPMLSEATVQQKAKFVKLLSEAKKTVLTESAGRLSTARQAEIIEDLGNGYFLGDDSYDDDEGFVKEGFSVYFQEGPDQYRHVGHVNVSPYPRNRQPGEVERKIQELINGDQQLDEFAGDEKSEQPRREYPITIYIYSILHNKTITIVGEKLKRIPYGSYDQVHVEFTVPTSGKTRKMWMPVTDKKYPTGTLSDNVYLSSSQTHNNTVTDGIFNYWAYEPQLDEEKTGVEQAYDDPGTHSIMSYAQQHYPEEPDLQAAFVKFVLRSLGHSKEDDERQDNEIELLLKRVNSLQDTVDKLKNEKPEEKKVANESFDWSDYRFVEDMDVRLDLTAAHFNSKTTLTESNDPDMTDYFKSLVSMSDKVTPGKKCIIVPLVLHNNKVSQTQFPEVVKVLEVNGNNYTVQRPSGITDTYPKTGDRGNLIFMTMVFTKVSSYDKFRTAIMLKFESPLPDPVLILDPKSDTQTNDEVTESVDYLEEK